MSSRLRALSFAVPALLAIGCGPQWIVVKQANPSPLVGKAIAVEPVHWDNYVVGKDKTEAEYLSKKKPETQQSYQADKQAFADNFVLTMNAKKGAINVAAQPPGDFTVRAMVRRMEPGNFNGFVNIPTVVDLALQIVDPAGQVIDEITYRVAEAASIYNPSVGGRLRSCANYAADRALAYLRTRVGQ